MLLSYVTPEFIRPGAMPAARLCRLGWRWEVEDIAIKRDALKGGWRAVIHSLERLRLRRACGKEIDGVRRGVDSLTIGRVAVEIGL
jgi:hypothetical protein